MKSALLFIAFCAISTWASAQNGLEAEPESRPAWLPITVGLHIASQHADSGKLPGNPQSRGWNNANTGAFLGWHLGSSQIGSASLSHQLIVGGFRNSLYQTSYYIALDTTMPLAQTRLGHFGAALSLFAVSGYNEVIGNYFGGPVPAGLRVANLCTPAAGCRDVLVKSVILPALAPGLDYRPALAIAPTLRLSYLHDSGGTGSKAIHLISRWSF